NFTMSYLIHSIHYIFPVIAVIAGFLFVLFIRPQKEKIFKLLLAFSGAFLLSITVFELLPEVFEDHSGKGPGIFIMCGIFLQIFLEFFSKGAEHGHIHRSPGHKSFPWMLFI